eukprot:TRINITY_DN10292_c0_g1_i1.p1 TRINITY_DN10292_c0_g1~~TRINITY_DN10292_c0_g1_i1.p1  ORF type:complete len:237 (+),score=50.75 TRINITY_DN10292_c0_g1_i1:78-788(+)
MKSISLMILACLAISISCSSLEAKKVNYLDHIGHNFLFRGNLPLNSTRGFQYDELVAEIRTKSVSQAGIKVAPKFNLIDVSLITTLKPDEKKDMNAEIDFFRYNPALGHFTSKPLYGQIVSPSVFPKHMREHQSHHIFVDHLPRIVRGIRDMLEDQSGTPKVIYWHCEAGCDRTGEISFAYSLSYLGMNAVDAWKKNVEICGRNPNNASLDAQRWWCYYAKSEGIKTTGGDCINFN